MSTTNAKLAKIRALGLALQKQQFTNTLAYYEDLNKAYEDLHNVRAIPPNTYPEQIAKLKVAIEALNSKKALTGPEQEAIDYAVRLTTAQSKAMNLFEPRPNAVTLNRQRANYRKSVKVQAFAPAVHSPLSGYIRRTNTRANTRKRLPPKNLFKSQFPKSPKYTNAGDEANALAKEFLKGL